MVRRTFGTILPMSEVIMSGSGEIEPDPSVIGTIAKPPFVQLPDPQRMLEKRMERFRVAARGRPLEGYLGFLADLTAAQLQTLPDLPQPQMPPAEVIARANQHAMPPLDRAGFEPDAAFDATLQRLLLAADAIDMPTAAREALERLKQADCAARKLMAGNVLADAIPVEALAEHVFVAAALQVHFARMAARLDKSGLVPVGDGACPCCGAPPVSSLIVGWPQSPGSRFCCCSLCGTLWNFVRSRCTVCGSTEQIAFQEVEGSDGIIKAETCGACHTYVKVLNQQKEPALDPVADDVASLGLDILVRELDFRRGAVNPFLIGY
jgi:FdhE protein